jgi:hypothetical protein
MKNKKIQIFCITHKPLAEISNLGLTPFGVGKNAYPKNFLTETVGKNISSKKSILQRDNISLLVLEE